MAVAPTKLDLARQSKATGNVSLLDPNTGVKHLLRDVGEPILPSDVATLQTVLAYAAAGQPLAQVRVALSALTTPTSVNISNPGTAIFDNVTLQAGDAILLAGQTAAPKENGIYIFDTASTPLVRRSDIPAATAINLSQISNVSVYVTEGIINSNSTWEQTVTSGTGTLDGVTDAGFLVDTDAQTWVLDSQVNGASLLATTMVVKEVPMGTPSTGTPATLDANGLVTVVGTSVATANVIKSVSNGSSLQLEVNGSAVFGGGNDYTLQSDGKTILFVTALVVGDRVLASYNK